MGIVNKTIITGALFIAVLLLVSLAQAGGNVSVVGVDVNYDGISYEGIIEVENPGGENVTLFIEMFVDNVKTGEETVSLNVTYFKGFRIATRKSVSFELPCEEGPHAINVFVRSETYHENGLMSSYLSYGCPYVEGEEEEEEKVEWLQCP